MSGALSDGHPRGLGELIVQVREGLFSGSEKVRKNFKEEMTYI